MDGYSLWELELQELIRDFTDSELSAEAAAAFLRIMQQSPKTRCLIMGRRKNRCQSLTGMASPLVP